MSKHPSVKVPGRYKADPMVSLIAQCPDAIGSVLFVVVVVGVGVAIGVVFACVF